jgi:Domain of unknown function (DUF4845)
MKSLRLVFGIFLIFAVIYCGWKIVPAYFNNYQFEGAMDDTARMAAADGRRTVDDIRAAVFEKAQSFSIPISAEDIQVVRAGQYGDNVQISADYQVRVDLPLHPINLQFHAASNREGLNFR